MSGQSQIRIKTGNALDTGATTSNVATNKAELEALAAANVDGKDTYPQSVSTQRLQVAQTLSIGDQVQMTDGCVSAEHLASGSVTTEKLNCTDVTTSNISFSGGSLSEFGVSTLGSITGGSLSVGSGGVTISNDGGTSGIYIGSNQIFCKSSGITRVLIDGATGTITATRFNYTADSSSTMNLSAGSITIGANASLGGTTCSTVVSGAAAGADAIQPGGGVDVNGSNYITTIDMSSGITIKTSTSTSRTQLTSNGMAIYNPSGTLVVQADHTNGLYVNNASSTPGLTERLSLAYGSSEQGWLAGRSGRVDMYSSYDIQLNAGDDVDVTAAGGYVHLIGGVGTDYGIICEPFIIVGGSSGPSITTGSGEPTSTPKYGSLYMSLGGSVWVYTTGGWKRIWHDGVQPGTVSHTHS